MIRLAWPCKGPVTQQFGENPSTYARFNIPGHNGVDVYVVTGTPIKAAAEGIVEKVSYDSGGYGNYIKIQHNDAMGIYRTLYAHLSSTSVIIGSNVYTGDIIGYSGNTGFSTGPHLHFELIVPWESEFGWKDRVDPMPYLESQYLPEPIQPALGGFQPNYGEAIVTATAGLNLRLEPTTSSKSIGTASYGDNFEWDGEEVEKMDGTWVRMSVWAKADWLNRKKPLVPSMHRSRRR
jgi:hypothetical protein